MRRPTIRDLALAADVSVATVNRILAGTDGVRTGTREKVRAAAQGIGFYGLGAIEARNAALRPRYRFGVLLLQPHRPFYQLVASALHAAVAAITDADIELRIEHLEDLSPQNTANRALALARDCEAISITTAVHPVITQAVEDIQSRGVPVFAMISQLSASGQVHYVGLDNWKVGRTAGWFFGNICAAPGKIGILLGNYRYRNQEMNETGFRSYFREYAPDFTLLEPMPTFESAAIAEEVTDRLLADNPDLVGLYIAGGGISGALTALRATKPARRLVVVGYELMDITRAALLDGTMTIAIAHPLRRLADDVLAGMIRAVAAKGETANFTNVVPFDVYTRENI
jgi:LacI family transcriptional regulator